MKLNKIELKGFKNIREIDLELNTINSLVALNNYGKSNVLDAINFGIEFIKSDRNVKSTMMGFTKVIPLNKNMDREKFSFLMELELKSKNFNYIVEYSYSFRWDSNDLKLKPKIMSEKLRIKENAKGQKYVTYFSRKSEGATYKSSETGRNNKKILINDDNLIINKLLAFDDLFYSDIIKQINEINVYVNSSLDASHLFESSRFQLKGINPLDISQEESIPKVIYTIKKSYPDKYELIKNTFIDLFPNIVDITVNEILKGNDIKGDIPDSGSFKIATELYLIFVKDKNIETALDFKSLSAGAKRVFVFLTYIILADINGVQLIAIEELENSIHPGLFYRFINIISQLVSEDLKIIISSHSPYIIQYMELDEIFVGIPNSEGLAMFSKIRKDAKNKIMKIADSYGMSTGDYIFEQMNGSIDEIIELESFLVK